MKDQKKKKAYFNVPTPSAGTAQADPTQVIDGEVQTALNTLQSNIQTSTNQAVEGVRGEVTTLGEEINASIEQLEQRVATITATPAVDADPMCGYRSNEAFFLDVISAGRSSSTNHADAVERLGTAQNVLRDRLNAAGSDEHRVISDPDGGFLIPEAVFGDVLMTDPFEIQADTGVRTMGVPMGTETLKVNARVDKNHASSVSGGLTVTRTGETESATSSTIKFEQVNLQVNELVGLSYATNRILSHSPQSLAALINAGFNVEWRSKLNDERINGTGAGQYMGVLNSPCLISVAKEGSQTADTIVGNNIIKMRSRAYGYGQSVWMANQDTLPQLMGAHIAGTNGDVFLFAPGNGTDKPDTLLGRPVIFDENCQTLGDKGDLILCNWSQYLEGQLGGAMLSSSMHVRFVEGESAFRFEVYNDGQPWWRSALTPKNSSTTLSPFVTLAARA